MADPSAVAILKKGKEVWNKTTTSRDLSGVDFAELMGIAEEMRKGSVGIPSDIFLKYTGIDFNGTNLRGADLSYVHIGANFADQLPARLFAYEHPDAFARLIDLLVDVSAGYLVRQFKAGVEAVQIFDTWAGILPAREFEM
jgi:hypothetical protein